MSPLFSLLGSERSNDQPRSIERLTEEETKYRRWWFLFQDRVTTENKELHLKMGIILEENARLKSIIYSMQQNGDNDDANHDRLWSRR